MSDDPQRLKILGVEYSHFDMGEEGSVYLTSHGLPFRECLMPDRFWTDKEWFTGNSLRLSGTSSLYRVRTKDVAGRQKDIVLKWNRMGQDIPVGEEDNALSGAEFNSPFEEFALVMQLREAARGSHEVLCTQKPLAIYTPADRIDLPRSGRRKHKMRTLAEKHVDIELDMHRLYAVIYEWIRGVDAVEANERGLLGTREVTELTLEADEALGRLGFTVRDRKPHHLIVRPRRGGDLAGQQRGRTLYALVDFELLSRTSDAEDKARRQRRQQYLRKQRDRSHAPSHDDIPPHLKHVNILGVDYIYGHTESTGGALWVVGQDHTLFDYFLPERWECSKRVRLSPYSEIFRTCTKDNINLVWKASKVGVVPDADPYRDDGRRILEHGYNSPFEEVSLATRLNNAGVPTVYPRAIYASSATADVEGLFLDESRYGTHVHLRRPDGSAVLGRHMGYILICGYWNGPDEKLAARDEDYYLPVSALRAFREGRTSLSQYLRLMASTRDRLACAGVEDLDPRGSHLLLSVAPATGQFIMGRDGLPDARLCNFELLRETRSHGSRSTNRAKSTLTERDSRDRQKRDSGLRGYHLRTDVGS